MIVLLCFSLLFLGLGIFFFLFLFLTQNKNTYQFETDVKENPKFTILIPARNESNVIEGILKSILNQTRKLPMKDVFVIVESKDDPTVLICNKYGASVIVRQRLELKSKGYALMEAIESLDLKKKYYDAYFIMDADNTLDEHYLEEMEKDYLMGYGISTGYRNIKNGNNVLAVSAGLTYTFINEWLNKTAMTHQKNLLLSGTGFYIHGKYIKEWGTYPFHSLTEDVELSHYATLHAISMHYNDQAIFYDEQPENFHQSVVQRKRWIFGYFENYFKMFSKYQRQLSLKPINKGSIISMMYGILEVICLLLGFVFFLSYLLCQAIVTSSFFPFWQFCAFLGLLYFLLAFVTMMILGREKNRLNYNKSLRWKVIFYHPIFLISYVFVFFLTILKRDIRWDPILHGGTKEK